MNTRFAKILLPIAGLVSFAVSAIAQTSVPDVEASDPQSSFTLITNVRIFDGKSDELTPSMSVLIEGNKISKIAKVIPAPDKATVINGEGRTLTPGFIDTHVHLMWNTGMGEFFDSPPDYLAALTLVEAKNTLMRGFTTVRDTGGAVLGVKKAIDQWIPHWTPHLCLRSSHRHDIWTRRLQNIE
ncbi:amidohydrolase family protein [Rubritalea squalenifaciens]|uniref:amidohydrolase family protein n=1 Tax=Rubritalea squalenifaciens TaxID=407226 RepID=UPI00116117FD|nr:amidohydrolase family protein [Rubritalea squalenifaciens]